MPCRVAALVVLIVALGCAQAGHSSSVSVQEKVDLWLSIRETMRNQVQSLGAYTCIQNITRYETPQNAKAEQFVDSVRMQVTATRGSEYYSWPGSPNAVSDPRKLLRTGLLGTGLFQGYAHSLFFSPGPGTLDFLGREAGDNGALLHFRFTFDSLRYWMNVDVGTGRAAVAAKGEFWADEKDRRIRRLLIESAGPAPEINVQNVRHFLEWAPVQLRGKELLLPQTANIQISQFSAESRRNEISLSQCREFYTDSTVSFSAQPSTVKPGPPPAVPAAAGFLPEGVIVPIRLLSAIDVKTAAVGNSFEAEVSGDVAHEGNVLLRKGDRVEGRIRRLGRYQNPEPHTLLWLEIATIFHGNSEYVFLGEVTRKGALANLIERVQGFSPGPLRSFGEFGGVYSDRRESLFYGTVPGVASLLFRGNHAVVPAGYPMEWRTSPPRTDPLP